MPDISLELVLSVAATIAIGIAFVRGARAFIEINRIYHTDTNSIILRTIRDGVGIKVFAAAWFGGITLLGVLGYGPFPILRPISLAIAILVLDLPSRYLRMIRLIQNTPIAELHDDIQEIQDQGEKDKRVRFDKNAQTAGAQQVEDDRRDQWDQDRGA